MRQERARLARAARSCALASAALACQAHPAPRPNATAVDERTTPEPPPPAAPADPPPLPPDVPPPAFSLALLRDGPLHLRSVGERALLLIDGEVVPLGPDGPARDGRPSVATSDRPLAYAETPSGEAWLVTGWTNPRAGGLRDVAVHHLLAGRWTTLPPGGQPGLLQYYSPLLVRGETVLGQHAAAIDGDLEDDTAAEAAAKAAFARAPRGFVRLSGPADDIVPVIPEGWTVGEAAVAADGTIYGLAHRGDTATTAVLAWSRDHSEPATIAVPPDLPPRARLTVTGRCLLLAGSPRYLLVGRGGALERGDAWQRVTVDLSESTNFGVDPGPALCTDAGELWLTLTEEVDYGPQRRLLHRSAAGAWRPITLPPPDERLVPEHGWIFDSKGWVEGWPQPGYDTPAYVHALAWDGQRLWVLADFGRLVSDGDWLPGDRMALYVGDALTRPPTVLPAIWERTLEHALGDRRAPGDCATFTIALGTTTPDDPQRAALRALATTSDDGGVDLLYLGELDGRRELVVQASAYDRASATRLARKVGAAVGARVKADCRARRLIEAVEVIRAE